MNGLKYIRRNEMDITQDKLAEQLNVSKQLVSMWENGKKKIPEKRLIQLESISGIPRRYFLIEDLSEREKLEIKQYRLRNGNAERRDNMHVWVLETFDREDEYCEYNSEVVAIYSESKLKEAKNHFERLCNMRIDDEDEVDRWEDKNGYYFSSENGECETYKSSYVGLKRMELL